MSNFNLVDDDAQARDAIPGLKLAIIALIMIALALWFVPRDEFRTPAPAPVATMTTTPMTYPTATTDD